MKLRVLLFTFAPFCVVTMASAQNFGSGTSSDVDWSNLTTGSQSLITQQTVSESLNVIEWQRTWNRLTGRAGETAPRVYDFMKKKVVVITLGRRSSGGYSIFVTGIRRSTTGGYVIDATERTPAPGSWVSPKATSPFVAIMVDKSANRFLLNLSEFEPQPPYNPYQDPYDPYFNRPPTNPPVTGNPNDNLSPVDWSPLTSSVRSRAVKSELFTATSAADFQQKYANLTGTLGSVAPGNINWNREMVVFVTLGTRSTGGYSVFVKGVRSGPNGSIIVDAVEKTPVPGGFVAQSVTSPWVAIKMGRVNGRILLNLDSFNR